MGAAPRSIDVALRSPGDGCREQEPSQASDRERFPIVGSHGGRPTDAIWAKSLRIHPDCDLRVHRRNMAATADEAVGDERDRVWGIVTADGAYLGYQKMAAPRVIPVFVLVQRAPAVAD